MAPEHPDVLRLAAGTEHEEAVRDYVNHALTETARSAATPTARRPASSSAARRSTRSTASGSRCTSPTTC